MHFLHAPQMIPHPLPPAEATSTHDYDVLDGRYARLERFNFHRHHDGVYELQTLPDAWERMAFLIEAPPKSVADFDAWMRTVCESGPLSARGVYYAVVDKATGLVGGYMVLRWLEPHNALSTEIVLYYGPRVSGTRAGTEAFLLYATHVFDTLGSERLGWRLFNQNLGSRRAARRLGFTFEGIARTPRASWKGYAYDIGHYSMLGNVEWPLVKQALQLWLHPDNFDSRGMQLRRLEDIRSALGWMPIDLGVTAPEFESTAPTWEWTPEAAAKRLGVTSADADAVLEGSHVRLERLSAEKHAQGCWATLGGNLYSRPHYKASMQATKNFN